jgi:hypothetical protein
MGPPLPLGRAAIEFIILFPSFFLVLLTMGWLRLGQRYLTNVVICPGCKRISNRDDANRCDCGLEYEDLTDWVWIPDDKNDAEVGTANPVPLTIIQRMQVWFLRFFAG